MIGMNPLHRAKLAAALLLFGVECALASQRAIETEVIVKAKLDDVWQAWTTSAGIKTFFAPDGRVEARVDGPFEIYFNPYAEAGQRGADGMRVLAIQDRRMLSFTWNAPPSMPEARKQRTYVTLRFEPQGEGETRLSLYHGGWGDGGEWDEAFTYFSKAWPRVLASLQKRFEEGPVDWTQWLEQLRKSPDK
jgi:uncharacterized protein YndB with AHSA1/START domain